MGIMRIINSMKNGIRLNITFGAIVILIIATALSFVVYLLGGIHADLRLESWLKSPITELKIWEFIVIAGVLNMLCRS